MQESLLNRIEEKTNVNKETIISLAKKLQEGNYKDENTLRSIIQELSSITGREVTHEKENKIIDMIVNDKVPKDIEKYV
jgi:ribosomal protein S18